MQRSWPLFIYIFVIHFFIQASASGLYRVYLTLNSDALSFVEYLQSFAIGLIFDFTVAIYTFIPLAIILFIAPKSQKFQNSLRRTLVGVLSFELFIFLFSAVSEYFFFKEFNDRFNFIAVDYLVYTNEVLANIWESYHLVPISLSLLALTIVLSYLFNKQVFRVRPLAVPSWKQKTIALGIYALVFAVLCEGINEKGLLSTVKFSDEILLAKNGMHSLFAAYRNNEISYDKYYSSMNQAEAMKLVHDSLKSTAIDNTQSSAEDETSIVRNIVSEKPALKKNVVLVLMESMSARYLGKFGSDKSITPVLDHLADESLFFDNAFSTGTRTVRGIEAVTLSIPPTPGQSIVRRPAGTNLFNIGTVFQQQGYENKFIYGGNAVFDNMGSFFSGNGFNVVDQRSMTTEEVTFSNAWGVCDEDLFNKVLSEADLSYQQKKPFFNFVLTTSNHRPYTYPENKVDIPSGTGRDGAVKYSDFSIGEFLKNAEKKPWYKDTVFIFISDHNASVAGGEKIQIEDYRIPIIIYSPGFIKPEKVSDLVSQIDLAPTLFRLLNFSYQSRFFGVDAFSQNVRRAFIGTYQKVGYYDGKSIVLLSPTKLVETVPGTLMQKNVVTPEDDPLVKTTVSFYQIASQLFREGYLKESNTAPTNINRRYYR